ncbi:dipeptidyl peptidase 2 isoform X1 [Narcine bancroftii]|uniref:dipeptidyl peptidase 2 isoform X1 n=1 Tax=Narcine bancroftii TaxID=1343680 RepID=UPI003831AAA7
MNHRPTEVERAPVRRRVTTIGRRLVTCHTGASAMRRGAAFGLLLGFALSVPAGQHFLPPGMAPRVSGEKPASSADDGNSTIQTNTGGLDGTTSPLAGGTAAETLSSTSSATPLGPRQSTKPASNATVALGAWEITVPGRGGPPLVKEGPSETKDDGMSRGKAVDPKPETTTTQPKLDGVKRLKLGAHIAVEEKEGGDEEDTLLSLTITVDSNHAQTRQVYLLIKTADLNVHQRETEVPVDIQIPAADTTIGTPTTGTADVFETEETVINIEEIVEKKIKPEPDFKELYMNQLVDHFSFSTRQKTYRQRYLMTDKFWLKSIGPIFLYTGNEGDIWDFANSSRFITELATEQQALVIFAEHRYYGKSLPFGKKSYEKINIEFLTVEQAVADYVVLITKLKNDLNAENCPVIAFGGSYGGMLSVYIRIKYPNIVEGALASSAPVVSVANIGYSWQFFHDVTKGFERNSPDCVSKIREAFQELELYAQQRAWNKITEKLSLCKPLKSKKEVDHLYGWARNAFTYLAMFNYPYKTEMGLHFPANPVNVACNEILKKNDHIEGLLSILGMFYNSTGTKKCFDIYAEFQHCADPTGCGLGSASQPWDFQVCTEINLLYETNNETDMFPVLPFTETMRNNYCHSKWGVNPDTKWLKIQFWGDDLKAASNIIFSNGDLDPWANGGILRNVTPSVVAFIIEGGAHHLDLRAANPSDPQSVTIIRKRESSIISEWVKKYQHHSA